MLLGDNMASEIQYIADSMLIDKIYKLDSVLTKRAGVVDELFSGVKPQVESYVKSNIDDSSTGALAKSVLNMIKPSNLYNVHDLLSALYLAAKKYNFPIVGIINSVYNSVSNKIISGQKILPEEVDQSVIATASLSELRKLEKQGALLRTARMGKFSQDYRGVQGANIMDAILGSISKDAAEVIVAGFVVWFVKTILGAAGFLGTGDHQVKEEAGTQIPLVQGSVERTVLSWVPEFYPDLSGYEDIILNTPSFRSVVRELSGSVSNSSLILPDNFNKKSSIDKFIADVQREVQKLQKETNENA